MAKSFSVAFRSFLRGSLAVSALTASGCSVYDEALLHTLTQNDGGNTQHCVAGTAGCIPDPPAASTSSPSDAIDMSFALRDVLLTQTNSGPPSGQPWRYIGFNLDGIDTQSTSAPNGCATPPNPDGGGVSDTYPLDGSSGIDNQFGAQLAGTLLPVVAPNMQTTLCCYQNLGRGTLMLRIRGWNGQPDDASVTMSLTTALDGTSDDPTTLSYDPMVSRVGYVTTATLGTTRTPAANPSWVPDQDTWYTNAADVSGGDLERPRHVDVNAYVRDGYFVMHLDVTQSVKLFLGEQNGIAIGLRNGTMIAHMSANQHLLDQGWIGGRMGSTELLDASYRLQANTLYSINNGGDNTSACSFVTSIITPLLDAYGDVLANGTNSASTPCDALSAGVSFRGVRAKEVRLAPASLAIPLPDCDGQQAVFGTEVPEETAMACPGLGIDPSTSPPCSIRNWNMAD